VVDVDVDVEDDVEDEVVLDVEGGGGASVLSGDLDSADAEASEVHHTNAAPAMATTASTAATL
jgi:hypothetical protein